jgi:rhamnosyl/mannosyltransferase
METLLQTLCAGERRAVESHALVVNRGPKTTHEVVDGVKVTRVGSPVKVGAVALAPTLPLWLARTEADLIVLHEPNPMALVAYFLARPRAPLVIWYHSEVVRPAWRYRTFYRPFLEFALRRVSCVVVGSPPMSNAPALAGHRDKCVVIPYGVDVDRFRPGVRVTAEANARRERARRPILLFVGRLVRYKGLEVLLEALPGLDAQTVIIGDGPHRAAIEAMVTARGLSDRVQLVGEVSEEDLVAWLHACVALVLPSTTRQESFGIVQLEAMLCGRPVVSTDLPTGVPWVNVHNQTGLVVPVGDAAALREALDRLVTDDELRLTLGDAARERVLQTFTADRMCTAMLSLYRELAVPEVSEQPAAPSPKLTARAASRSR